MAVGGDGGEGGAGAGVDGGFGEVIDVDAIGGEKGDEAGGVEADIGERFKVSPENWCGLS